jgi:hypothetical protein
MARILFEDYIKKSLSKREQFWVKLVCNDKMQLIGKAEIINERLCKVVSPRAINKNNMPFHTRRYIQVK